MNFKLVLYTLQMHLQHLNTLIIRSLAVHAVTTHLRQTELMHFITDKIKRINNCTR